MAAVVNALTLATLGSLQPAARTGEGQGMFAQVEQRGGSAGLGEFAQGEAREALRARFAAQAGGDDENVGGHGKVKGRKSEG